ncbi:MAG: pirin family protein [Acidiferrobacter sp.]
MEKIIHRAESRGYADHRWLQSHHTFSFANYHNPERMNFGQLRVLNDDVVEPGQGFDTHPHENMEIVSIPLSGALRHKDSMGNVHVVSYGEVQAMSAGTGITHSEYNDSQVEPLNFLQIWVMPREKGIQPRYEQKAFPAADRNGHFQVIVSPDRREGSLLINQEAYFSLADFPAGSVGHYNIQKAGNGVYCFVIDGRIEVDGELLRKRDAIGLSELSTVTISISKDSQILCIEVPAL